MNPIENLGYCELLCQLAEEASELAQAALKLRRTIDGTNPTPRTFPECCDNLIEELADCYVVLYHLDGLLPMEQIVKDVISLAGQKERRWIERLEMISDRRITKENK